VERLKLFNTTLAEFELDIQDAIHEHYDGEDYLSMSESDEIAKHLDAIVAIVHSHPMYYPTRSRPPKEYFEKKRGSI